MPSLDVDPFQPLLEGARGGERAAWEALYRQFAPTVLGLLRAQRVAAPDDLLAEVWLQVVRDLPRFSGSASGFRAWILRIANNRVVDERRSEGRRPVEVAVADVPELPAAPEAAPIEGADELEQLFTGLTETQRAVLYLRYVLDLPQGEIAAVLESSVAAVKMQQRRAVDAIAARMDREARQP